VEPLSDKELDDLLRHYVAPAAPATLEAHFFPQAEPLPWWRWLASGSLRVPVPAVVAAVVLLAVSMLFGLAQRQRAVQPPQQHSVTLADFQLVKQLQPRIIRRGHERN
jgi:hypothetical protein